MTQIVNTNETISIDQLSAEAKAQVKAAVLTIADSMTRVEAERDVMKTTVDDLSDELGIDKRLVRKIAKVYFKNNYAAEKESFASFEEFYDGVMK